MSSLPKLLGGKAPREVMLDRSPLVRVIAQVRFSDVLKIDTNEGAAPFQEKIRGDYPILVQDISHQVKVDIAGGEPRFKSAPATVWRFSDEERLTRVSLTSNTLTLEVRRYGGRSVFLPKLNDLVGQVEEIFKPSLALRLGVRYINRMTGESLQRITELVRTDLVGVAHPNLRNHVIQAMSEATLTIAEGALLMRWGVLPPDATIDSRVIEPVSEPSWILDIDAYSTTQAPFTRDGLDSKFQALADRAYAVFRYALKPAALTHFGSRP